MAAPSDPCPFCGGNPIRKRPLLDGATIDFRTAVGIDLSLTLNSGESYLKCRGCTREYVPADRDVRSILHDLEVKDGVQDLIELYHGEGVTVADLVKNCRTGIVRKARRYRSYVSVSAARNEIIVCFLRGGVRTFGTFARKSGRPGGGGGDRYILKGLSRA